MKKRIVFILLIILLGARAWSQTVISISNVSSCANATGVTVNVPVTVQNFNGIAAFQFWIDIPGVGLTFPPVLTPPPAIGGTFLANQVGNQVIVAWFNSNPVTVANGTTIFDLTFTFFSSAATVNNLIFDDTPPDPQSFIADVNGNTLPSTFIDGSITKLSLGSMNPTGIFPSTPVCAGTSQTYYVPVVTNATLYTWSITPVTAPMPSVTGGQGNDTVTIFFPNNVPQPSYAIRCDASDNCGNFSSAIKTITVNPLPSGTGTISVTGNPTVFCQGVTYNFNVNTGIGGILNATTYNWTFPAGTTITPPGNTSTVSVVFNSAVTNFSVQVVGQNNCGTQITTNNPYNLTVNPRPIANAGPDQNTFLNTQVTLSGSGSGGSGGPYTYSWTPVNMIVPPQSTWQNPQTVVLTADVIYILVVTDVAGCQSDTNQIRVHIVGIPLAIASVTATPSTICNGDPTTLHVETSGGTGSGYTYSWNTVPPTGVFANTQTTIVSPTANTTYSVTVTDVTPDPDVSVSGTVTVTVNPLPVPTFSAGPNSVCVNSTGNVYTTQAGMTNYTWVVTGGTITAGGGLTDNSATVTWNTVGNQTVSVTYTNLNNCTGTGTRAVTVNALPVAGITLNPGGVCLNTTTATITGTATGGSNVFTSYSWTYSGTGTLTFNSPTALNTTITGTAVGSGTITLTIADNKGCVASASAPFEIYSNPIASILGLTPNICLNQTWLGIDGNPSGGTSPYTIHQWATTGGITVNFTAAGSQITNILATGVGSGSIKYTVTDSHGCIGISTVPVTIDPVPIGVATPSTQTVCSDIAINNIVLSTSNNLTGTTYAWTRDNTTNVTGIAASGVGNISGTLNNVTGAAQTVIFTITPTTGACDGLTFTSTVIVNPEPEGVATPSTQTVCSDAALTTIALSTNNNLAGTTFTWTRDNTTNVTGMAASGNGNVSGSLNNVTGTPQTVTFTFTPKTGNCFGNAFTATVIIDPEPVGVATPSNQTHCSNVAINNIALSTSNNLAGTSYTWTRNNTVNVTGIANSGAGDISGVLTNVTGTAQTVIFTITPTTGSCAGNTFTANVIVNPEPVGVATPSNQTVCSDSPLTNVVLSTSNALAGTTYAWSRDNTVNVTGIAASGVGNITGSMNNVTGTSQTVTFTITPTTGTCTGSTFTATVIVDPEPVGVAAPSTQTLCSQTAINPIILSNSNNLSGTTYTWTRNNTVNVTGMGANGSGDISGTLINVTASVQTVTFTITPTTGTCTGNTFTATVILNPEPVGVATPSNQSVCSDIAINNIVLSTSNNLTGTTFAWTRDNTTNVTGIAASGSGNITGTLNNVTGTAQTVIFTITPTSGSCVGNNFTATVIVNPEPVGVATPSNQTVCSHIAISNIVLSTSNNLAGTTYAWTRDNTTNVTGLAANGSGNITGTLNNVTGLSQTVTFTITPTSGSCIGNTFTATVIVDPEPVGAANPSTQTLCSDIAINPIILSTSNNLTGTTYSWTRNNTVNVTGIAASGAGDISGTLNNVTSTSQTVIFTITPTSGNCTGSNFTATVILNPEPVGVAAPSTQTVCSHIAISNIVLSTSNNLAGTTYAWSRDNTVNVTGIAANGVGNISGILNNVTSTSQTVTFTIIPTTGTCAGNAFTATVIVDPEPVGAANPSTQTLCSNVALTPIVLSTTNNLAGTTFTWTRNNTINVTGIAAGGAGNITGTLINVTTTSQTVIFTITPTSGTCVGSSFTATVIISPEPVGSAVPASQSVCSNVAIAPILLSTSNNLPGTTYAWTRDNTTNVTGMAASGTGSINGTLTNTTNVAQTVTFTITPSNNGCTGNTFTATVNVYPPLIVNAGTGFSVPYGSSPVLNTGATILNGSGTYTYHWSPAALLVNPNILIPTTVSLTGYTEFSLYVIDQVTGCTSNTDTVQIHVSGGQLSIISVTATPPAICNGASSTLLVNTTGGSGNPYTYSWNTVPPTSIFATTASAVVSPSVTTTYSITVTDITPVPNVSVTGTVTLTVNPVPIGVAAPSTQTVCSDIAITDIVLSTSNNLAGTTYAWTRNNTVNVTGIAASGTGNISGTFNNVTGTAQTVIFTIIPTTGPCVGNSFTATVIVNPEPVGIANPATQTVCSDVALTTVLLSTSNNLVGTSYSWTRDNTINVTGIGATGVGNISGSLNNVTGVSQTVVFTITPTSGTCVGNTFTATVIVNPEPVGVANPLTQTVCSDVPINNIALSNSNNLAGTTYTWTRNNTINVTVMAASGTGDISGTLNNVTGVAQTVLFTITPTSGGCTGNTFTATVIVNPEPVGVANPSTQTVCSDSPIADVILSTSNNLAGTTYAWTRDNNVNVTGIAGSGAGNITGTPNNVTGTAQTVIFTITPTSGTCNGNTFTATVIINPEPVGIANPSTQTVCSDATLATIVLSTGNNLTGTTYAWTRDNITNVTGMAASGSGNITGSLNNVTGISQTVTFTFTPSVGTCVGNSFTATVVVDPEPVGVANPSTQTLCSDVAINTISLSTSNNLAGTTYSWTRNNTVNVTGIANSGTGDISGTFNNVTGVAQTVVFTITPTTGSCAGNTFTATVIINPEPVGVANPSTQTVCSNIPISNIVLSTSNNLAGTNYSWTRDNIINVTGIAASGAGDITGTPINVTGTAQTVIFTITPATGSCTGNTFTSTVNVNLEPVGVATPSNQTVCSDVAITTIALSTSNNVVGTTYSWTRNNTVNVTGIATSGTGDISGTLNNVTGTPQTVTFTIIPSIGSCSGNSFTATVIVNPEPVGVANPSAQTLCSDIAITPIVLSTSNNLAGTTYAWTRDNTTNVTGIAASGTGNISGTLNNVTGAAQTVIFTITPTAGLCTGNSFTATVIMNPEPVGVATPSDQTVCSDVAIANIILSTSNNLPGTTYAWTRDNTTNVTGIAASGVGNITGTMNNVTGSSQTVTFTIIPTSGSCIGNTFTATVVVDPEPVGIANPATQTLCSDVPLATVLLTTSNNLTGTTYAWTRNNTINVTGIAASGTGDISGTLNNVTGTAQTVIFTITPTSGTCAGNTFTATVIMNPEPVGVAAPSTQTVCSNIPISNILLSSSNNLAGTTFAWSRDNSINVTGIAASGVGNISGTLHNTTGTAQTVTFTITPTTGTCVGNTYTAIVNVNPEPVGVATPSNQTVCSNVAIEDIILSTSNNLTGTVFAWTRDNTANVTGIAANGSGNITGTLINTTGTPQTVIFTITPTSGSCVGSNFTATVIVNPEPVGVASIPSQFVCSNIPISNIVLSTSNNLTGTTYAWTRDNLVNVTGIASGGAGDISGTMTNNTNIAQTVTFTIIPSFNGCSGNPFTATVTVYPPLVVDAGTGFSITYGFSTTLTTGATVSNGSGTYNYFWSPAGLLVNPNVLQPTTVLLYNNTIYSLYVVDQITGCISNTDTIHIDLTGGPLTLDPYAFPDSTICYGESASIFANASGGAGTNSYIYSWTSNPPGFISSAANPVVTPLVTTTYIVQLSDGQNVANAQILITVNPTAQVDLPANQVVCNNDATTAVVFNTTNTGGIATYEWINDNTSIGLGASGSGDIPSFTAVNTGTSPVVATVTVTPYYEMGGVKCVGPSQSFTFTVNPTGQVNDPTDQVVCNNAPTTAVTFTTNHTGGTTAYSWVNNTPGIGLAATGNGNIPSFTAINTGTSPVISTITVTPHFTNGGVTCDGPDQTFTITVNPSGQVNDPVDQVVCNNFSVAGINYTTNNSGGTTTYSWTNDNTSIGLLASGNGDIIPFTADNTGTAPVVATITVTPHFTNGTVTCDGPIQTFTITVNPTAQVNDPADQVVCNNSSTTAVYFTTNNTGGTTAYSWTNDNVSIGLGVSGNGNIPIFTATNTTSAPIIANITVTPHYTNATITCDGPTQTFTITVNPSGQVNVPVNQVVCNGNTTAVVNFATVNTGGTTTYSWTNDNTSIGLAASGNGNITAFTAVNTGTSPVIATIVVIPHFTNSAVSCDGPTQSFTITVNPTGQVNDPTDIVICNNELTTIINFTTNNSGGTTTYSWTNDNTSIGLADNGTGNIAAFTAVNTGLSPVVATITVTPHYANLAVTCDGPPQTFTITVNPDGHINDPADIVVCNNTSTTQVVFTTNNTGGTTTYSWANNNTSIGLAANGSGNLPSFTAVNTGTSPVVATITVTPHFENGLVTCDGPDQTFTITVNPSGQVNDPADQVVCNNTSTTAITFTTSNTGGITTYSWTNNTPGIGLGAGANGNIPSFTAINTGTSPVIATITVTPHFTNASVTCDGPVQTFTITVNPTGQVNDPVDQVVCNGNSITAVNFSTNITGGTTTYSWVNNTPSIGLIANGNGNIAAFNAINTGTSPVTATITVTPHFANGGVTCDGPVQTFSITVNPTGQVNDPVDLVVCNGSSTGAISFTTTNTGGTTTYSWANNTTSIGLAAVGNGNITAFNAVNTGTSPVVATITVTPHFTNATVTCDGPAQTFTITVNPTGQVNDPADQVVCHNAATTLVTFTTNNTGGTTTYTWTNSTPSIGLLGSGNGNIASFTAVNTSTAPVVATITVTPHFTNGTITCNGSTQTFTITVNPAGQVNDPTDQVVCNGNNTTAVNFSTNNTGGTTTYTWVNNTTSIGLGASGNGNIAAFSAVNTGTSPVVATITVTPHFTNGGVTCDGTAQTFTITVNPTGQVNDPADQIVCNGTNTTAVTFATINTGGTTTYSWTNSAPGIGLAISGTGNIAAFSAVNTSTAPVIATITITPHFLNGTVTCNGTAQTFTITVNPSGQVNDPANQVVCNNATTTAVNFTTNNTGGTTTYSWTNSTPTIGLLASGNGNIASFTAINTGTAPVVATITVTPHFTNGSLTCDGPVQTFTITVNPSGQVNDPADQTLCHNALTTAVNFSTTNTGGTTTYSWTNNNTTIGLAASGTGNIPAFTATNTGASPVTATITVTPHYSNGGVSCDGPTQTFTITVNPLPVPTITGTNTVCAGSTGITYTTETGMTGYTWAITPAGGWIITGGAGTNVITVTWNTAGTKTVSVNYTNSNGCTAANPTTYSVNVIAAPTVNAGPDTTVCLSDSLLIDLSAATNYSTLSWSHNGDGNFSNTTILHPYYIPGPNDITNGSVTITLTVTGNTPCGNLSDFFILTISEQTEAYAGPDTAICAGQTYVIDSATTTNANSFTWTTSGTGSFSDPFALHPTYYPSPADVLSGNVSLYLNAVNTALYCGNSTDSMSLTIKPLPVANAGPDTTICLGDLIQLHAIGGTTYLWSPALGLSINNVPDPIASPAVTTTYTVSVTLNGCSKTDNMVLSVRELPIANAGSDADICQGDSTRLAATGGYTYLWNTGATTPATWVQPAVTSQYMVTVYDDLGCNSSDTVQVTVHPLPTVVITPPSYSICRDSTVDLTASGASMYHWSPSSGLSNNNGPLVTAFPRQTTTYIVTGITMYGCESQTPVTIRVYLTPEVILRDSAYICLGNPYYLNAGYNDSASFQWQDGSTSQFYLVSEPGIYWVTVRNAGCAVSDTVKIDICSSVWIPNSFTPDGNNLNDVFLVKSSTELKMFNMYIYNRWGEVIFHTTDINEGWDGRLNGNDCPEGVYIYLVTWEGQGNLAKEREGLKKGTILLVR